MTDRRGFFGALAALFAGFTVAGASAPGGAADLEAHDDIYALSASRRLMACRWHSFQRENNDYKADWLYVRGEQWNGCPALGDSWHDGRKVISVSVEETNSRNSNWLYTIVSRRALQ